MLSLTDLVAKAGLAGAQIRDGSVMISGVASDSRQVGPGFLFVAIGGTASDGAQYIADAKAKGAAAIASVLERSDLVVTDAREAVAKLSAAFYGPAPAHLYAITGTDGKTSTADFTRQLAGFLGHKAASIGTLGLRSPDERLNKEFPANNTSPEPVLLHRTMRALARAGVTHLAIEASSHGLDQKRLEGVKFAAAAYTNLTRDHLDYHKTAEAYGAAKARLFTELLPIIGTAVLNRDDDVFESIATICKNRGIKVKSFGRDAQADYQILEVIPHTRGMDAHISLEGKKHNLSLPLYGAFQLYNMLAAMALLASDGAPLDAMVEFLPRLTGVPGRLEKVAEKNGAPIFVDYAHTPAALANILKTLRPHTTGKLHVVFGAGGDRDTGKRPEMGSAAAMFADSVIVTDDNPRSEDPVAIRAAILAAAPGAKEIAGRDIAIREAVKLLSDGDVLVVAGKGHETSQTIGSKVIHFSDAEHIQEAVR